MASPTVVSVGVDEGSNKPTGDPNGPDGEVTLDIEVVGAVAPGAKIAVYFTTNTDSGFIDAVTNAVHDTTNNPSVISISWGGPESAWTSQSLQAFNSALQAAATMGVTVCVASGDSGSSDGSGGTVGRFSGVEPVCAGMRRHQADCVGGHHHAGGGVERRHAGRRKRRRRERGFCGTDLAEGLVVHQHEAVGKRR